MSVEAIIRDVNRLGIVLSIRDDKIFARPLSAVSPELAEAIRLNKTALLAYLHARKPEATGRDLVDELREHAPALLNELEDRRTTPAESIVETCRRHGIALRLDECGRLVVGNADGSGREPAVWSTLLVAIEAHLPAITALVAAGFDLRADLVAHEAA
jgi:TubC N-terminal docking domain